MHGRQSWDDVEICILAGGKSSRMGQDKKQMDWAGMSLLVRVERLAGLLTKNKRIIAQDERSGCGPLGGVFTALRTSNHSHCIFLPIDMPLLTTTTLDAFCVSWSNRGLPHFTRHGDWLGFPFAVPKAFTQLIQDMVDEKEFALWLFARRAGATEIESTTLGPVKEFANVNTPEEFEHLRKESL